MPTVSPLDQIAVEVRIGIGVAWPFILAICVRIELRAAELSLFRLPSKLRLLRPGEVRKVQL
jgi:hypothetical protein